MQEKRCRTRQKSKDQILSQKKKQNKKVHCKNVEQEELNTNTGKIICIDILSLTAEQKAQNAEDFCGSNVSFFSPPLILPNSLSPSLFPNSEFI